MSKFRQKKDLFIRTDPVLDPYGPDPQTALWDAELTEDDRQGDQKTEHEVVQFQSREGTWKRRFSIYYYHTDKMKLVGHYERNTN